MYSILHWKDIIPDFRFALLCTLSFSFPVLKPPNSTRGFFFSTAALPGREGLFSAGLDRLG